MIAGVAGVVAARDVGAGHDREQRRVVGDLLAEVGVQVDVPSWPDSVADADRSRHAAPRRRHAPVTHREPRPHPHRRLRVAARQGVARGHGVPRGRERLHPGAHRAPRRPAPGDLRRDQGAHPRDRPVGADPQPRLLVLRPLLRGQGVRRQLPGPGRRPRRLDAAAAGRGHRARPAGAARRAGAARPRRARRGPRVLLPRRLQRQPRRHPARLLHRRGRRRALHDPGQGPRAPASCCPDEIAGVTRRRHLGPRRRALLLHDRRRRPGAPTRSGGTGSAPPRPTTSSSTTRPTAASGSASAARRSDRFLVDRGRLEDHLRVPLPRRRRPRRRLPGLRRAPRGARVLPRPRRDRRRGRLPGACTTTPAPDFELGTAPVAPTAAGGLAAADRRTTPPYAWRTSTPSPATWSCTSAARA